MTENTLVGAKPALVVPPAARVTRFVPSVGMILLDCLQGTCNAIGTLSTIYIVSLVVWNVMRRTIDVNCPAAYDVGE
jgi:hypothetical protein